MRVRHHSITSSWTIAARAWLPRPAWITACALVLAFSTLALFAASFPVYSSRGMVVAQETIAAHVGAQVLRDGGNAIDAAVATAFALAVTYPTAGNIGGGGFIVYRAANGDAVAYDFREMAPAKAHAQMFLKDGNYDSGLHHRSHLAVGVPGTVAGLIWPGRSKENCLGSNLSLRLSNLLKRALLYRTTWLGP